MLLRLEQSHMPVSRSDSDTLPGATFVEIVYKVRKERQNERVQQQHKCAGVRSKWVHTTANSSNQGKYVNMICTTSDTAETAPRGQVQVMVQCVVGVAVCCSAFQFVSVCCSVCTEHSQCGQLRMVFLSQPLCISFELRLKWCAVQATTDTILLSAWACTCASSKIVRSKILQAHPFRCHPFMSEWYREGKCSCYYTLQFQICRAIKRLQARSIAVCHWHDLSLSAYKRDFVTNENV